MSWQDRIDRRQPCWQDYLPFLDQLIGRSFPDCDRLNALLPDKLFSGSGQPIQFVSSTALTDDGYENRIFDSGQISTRPDNWHDLFNALVWLRFPRIKTSINTLHCSNPNNSSGTRGKLRDALTLFDECGVIVFSAQPQLLDAVAQRNWQLCFQEYGAHWHQQIQIAISGHAMLEKFLAAYKSMTANALLVQVNNDCMHLSRDKLLHQLDDQIARQLLAGKLLTSPVDLAPLPLSGIPAWWIKGDQDDRFYADGQVFRTPPVDFMPAPIITLS